MIKAKFGKVGNIKLGTTTWTFSKLATNEVFTSKLGTCKGSCGKYCDGCKGSCYVRSSYRYPSVILGHMRNTLAFREDLAQAFSDLYLQLARAKKKPMMVRINQSGELESKEEFEAWCDLASCFPETKFWLYTKAYDIVTDPLMQGQVPSNMTVLISVWHEYGTDTFEKLQHLDNVKAFAYCDGFDYKEAFGLDITTKCNAYEGRKLNHEITCERCQKCFNRLASCKVIGCDAH